MNLKKFQNTMKKQWWWNEKSAIAIGTLGGVGFYALSEHGQKEHNRSYTASPATDALAFIGATYVLYRGWQLEEPLLVAIGSTINSIHAMQVVFNKGW